MSLGNRIRERRIACHLSQDKVAELVGVSRQAVTKWESGRSAPSTENLLRLAEIFGCSLDQLVACQPEPSQKSQLQTGDSRASAGGWRSHIPMTLTITGIWLIWFLLCKLIWAELGDQTVLQWLFGRSPQYHAYLFGWLLQLYLPCSLIAIIPALFGRSAFSATVTGSFLISIPLGEFFGKVGVGPGVHQGWLIWGGIFLSGILFGIVTELRRNAQPWRNPKWWVSAALTVFAIIILALINPPQLP